MTWNTSAPEGYEFGRHAPGTAQSWQNALFTYPGLWDNWLEAADLTDNYLSILGLMPDTIGYSASYVGYNKDLGSEYHTPYLYIDYEIPTVPIPRAFWLLCSGLLAIVGLRNKVKR